MFSNVIIPRSLKLRTLDFFFLLLPQTHAAPVQTRLRQDVCRFPATHVSKVPDLFLFVLFFSFSSKRETFSSRLFSEQQQQQRRWGVWVLRELLPPPSWSVFFSIFALSFVLFFGAVSQGGASGGGWSGRMKAAGGPIRHPVPPLSTTHPGLTLLVSPTLRRRGRARSQHLYRTHNPPLTLV